ncbi:CRTAC1 family protein [Isosphaeraceae bacterium EP7]
MVTRCGSPEKRSALDALGTGVALFDLDVDGDLDIYVAAGSRVVGGRVESSGGPWLFRNDGPGRWTEITKGSGLTDAGWAQGVAVADYDADGDSDLFVAHEGPDQLWRNEGKGVFRDVTAEAGLGEEQLWGASATWGDVDGDGWLDLYVTNYLVADPLAPAPLIDYMNGHMVFAGPSVLRGEPDVLWKNRGDGTFVDATKDAGLVRPECKGMGAVLADLDLDGDLDLYVTNDTQPNELFLNDGRGRFEEVAVAVGVAANTFGNPEGSMGVEVADMDGDGHLDLVYSNFRQEGTRLHLRQSDGNYLDASAGSRIGVASLGFVGWGIVLADFDDDGWPDLFQGNGHVYPMVPDATYAMPPLFLKNEGRASFRAVTDAWGPRLAEMQSGRAVAAGDLDGDGDVDLVMTTMDGPLRVLVNEGSSPNRSIRVVLAGKAPNTEGVGAVVELTAAGRTQVAVVRRGGSLLAASDVAAHFGVGAAERVDRLLVRWPDGTMQSHEGLPVGCRIIVRQEEAAVEVRPDRARFEAVGLLSHEVRP